MEKGKKGKKSQGYKIDDVVVQATILSDESEQQGMYNHSAVYLKG